MPPDSAAANPLLSSWTAPYGLPPFAAIQPAHFEPAFTQALREHGQAIEAIADQPQPPDFDNTVAAFDRSFARLHRLGMVFDNLCSSETSPQLQAVQRQMAPVLAA